jgi:hypothetical protein
MINSRTCYIEIGIYRLIKNAPHPYLNLRSNLDFEINHIDSLSGAAYRIRMLDYGLDKLW